MANRYDRDSDDYGSGRRGPARDDERRRAEAHDQRRDERQARPNHIGNTWREGQHERERSDSYWRGQDWRSQEYGSGREGGRDDRSRDDRGRDERFREGIYPENDYYTGRESSQLGRGYYSSGRDYSGERDQYGRSDRNRNDEGRNYRGYYQDQTWPRDPGDPRRFNAGDETSDRWRSDVGQQNRHFDIDRGWRGTSNYGSSNYGAGNYGSSNYGTSGYGNTTRGQSQFGKGPKGYVRSDERIREDVCDRLSDDDEVDASDITVTVKNAEVILEGTVGDRHSKHRAEDISESISGVREVTNHLRARKTFFQEIGDKISGQDNAEHQGHAGSGTRNTTTGTAPRTSH